MKNKYLQISFATLLLSIALSVSNSSSGIDKNKSGKLRLRKPDIVDLVFVNYNNWSYVMRNNGSYMYDAPDADHNSNNAGGEFPRGSGINIVYAGGVYIGAIKDGIPVVSETEYVTEFQPGRIVNNGVPFGQLKAEDPLLPSLKVHFIDHNDTKDWPDEALRDQFGNPALIADAQTWAVFNDIDTSLISEPESESPEPGLGIQVTLESYAFNGPKIGDVVFMHYTLTNKTNSNYSQSYFGIWSDPDVNNNSNDIVGVDTVRGLGYCYNNTNEGQGNDFSVGFDILQGPVVDKAEIPTRDLLRNQNNTTILTHDSKLNRFISKTLPNNLIVIGPVSSAVYAGSSDPTDNLERYNLMRGANMSTGVLKSGCGLGDYFAFRGNPITEQGTCDVAGSNNPRGGLYATAADQRMTLATGPFTIRAGETQEIWVAAVGASGNDRLDAVANLFATDDMAQSFFDAGFPAPVPPEIPNLSVTALDGRVALTWQNNAEVSDDLAGEMLGITVANGYNTDYVKNDFQGYRVYRSLTGLDGSFSLLAQYDKVDTLGIITNRFINTNNHLDIEDVNLGTNTGIVYHYVDSNLTNGQNYFYSVTAYDAQPYIAGPDSMLFDGIYILKPAGLPVSLESSLLSNVVSAVPAKPVLSIKYNASLDSSRAIHTQGTGDGHVTLEIVDVTKVRSLNYTIEFFKIPSDSEGGTLVGTQFLPSDLTAYRFIAGGSVLKIDNRTDDLRTFYDKNTNGTYETGTDIPVDESEFATSQASFTGSNDFQPVILHGIKITVFGPALGFKAFDVTANAGGVLNPPAAGAATFQGYPSSDPDLINDQQVNGSFWFIADWRSAAYTTGGYAAFVENAVNAWAGWDHLVPSDFEYRFTATGQMGQYRNTTTQAAIPFEVWNVSTGTQLLVDWLNDAGTGNFQLVNADHPASGGTNDPRTCRFYVSNPIDMSAGSGGYNTWLALNDNLAANYDGVIGRQVFVSWNGGETTTSGPYSAPLPEVGTIFRINTTKPNGPDDVFTFSTTANSVLTSKSELKKALKDIKVVPNPFYKYSSFETSFDKLIKFTNLPSSCTIKIFTVAGDLVKTLNHNETSDNDRVNNRPYDDTFEPTDDATSIERWDLKTANGRYVASGMYIALVESPAGKRLVKFAVIQ